MSFTQRDNTPNYSKISNLTEAQDYYNTFNKVNYSSLRDKIKLKNKIYNSNYNAYIPNTYNNTTFFRSKAPFNYYNNVNDRNDLMICYNGGPKKQYNTLTTRDNISQYLKNRSKTLKYKRPCGCYSKYYSTKYRHEYDYPNFERSRQYNTLYKQNNLNYLPNISGNDNLRYSYDFMTPRTENKKNITYKLKGNSDNGNNRLNTDINNYEPHQNLETENQEQNVKKEEIVEENHEEIKPALINEKEKNRNKKKLNYFNLRPRRRFHKIQIFNNYKPFLVDDFKEYGYYE